MEESPCESRRSRNKIMGSGALSLFLHSSLAKRGRWLVAVAVVVDVAGTFQTDGVLRKRSAVLRLSLLGLASSRLRDLVGVAGVTAGEWIDHIDLSIGGRWGNL